MTNTAALRTRADRYFDDAFAALNAGFRSEAARKNALADVARAYDAGVKGIIHSRLLAVARDERDPQWETLYWGIPDLHVWKAKHADLFAAFADAVALADACAGLRQAIKNAPVVKAEPKVNLRQQEIERRVTDIIALRREQYGRALDLAEIFGRLPVTASWHWVTNAQGTTFPRTFYYLAGRLTPLSIIIAALEATEEKAA